MFTIKCLIMFRVWTKNLGRVGKSEAQVYFLALTCSDAKQFGKPFLLKGNFISHLMSTELCLYQQFLIIVLSSVLTGLCWRVKILQNDLCAQRRLRSARASAQSDQSLRCPHEEPLGPYLPIERTAKTLIRLGGCPGWSESSLAAQVIVLVLLCCGSFVFIRVEIVAIYCCFYLFPNYCQWSYGEFACISPWSFSFTFTYRTLLKS